MAYSRYLFLLLVCGLTWLSCQPKTTTNLIIKPEVEYSKQDLSRAFNRHKRFLAECFKEYMEVSSFQNDKGYFDEAKVEKFKDLFMPNAKVYNDVVWQPDMIEANRYADNVWLLMQPYGIKVEYEEDVTEAFYTAYSERFEPIFDLADSTLNSMQYKFKTTKKVYHLLNKHDEVVRYDEAISYDLEFIFYVTTGEEKWAKLVGIIPSKNK